MNKIINSNKKLMKDRLKLQLLKRLLKSNNLFQITLRLTNQVNKKIKIIIKINKKICKFQCNNKDSKQLLSRIIKINKLEIVIHLNNKIHNRKMLKIN